MMYVELALCAAVLCAAAAGLVICNYLTVGRRRYAECVCTRGSDSKYMYRLPCATPVKSD